MHQCKPVSLFVLFAFLLCSFSFLTKALGQEDSLYRKVACDCKDAISIAVYKKTGYGFTEAPLGFGKVLEIETKSNNSRTAFEKEHHSAWYLLNINTSGKLSFDITPVDKGDDYDFLLFPMRDLLSCDSIFHRSLLPVRGNLSRNDPANGSITGLSGKAFGDFTSKGIGNQFSNPMFVESGEKYLLVLDNVYDNGKGHKIDFKIERKVKVSGKVSDETYRHLVADIELVDNKGNKIFTVKSNPDGYFSYETSFNSNSKYALVFYAPGKRISVENLKINALKAKDTSLTININLNSNTLGSYLPMLEWFFYPDDYKLMAESIPALNQLLEWMKQNPKVKVLIEGNTTSAGKTTIFNTISNVPDKWRQELSEKRALSVFKYLTKNGIDSNRIKTMGNAESKKLYAYPKNAYEHRMNDRIEVKIIGIK